MMAFDSASRRPSSNSTAGIRPKGNWARNCGVCVSPFMISTSIQVYGRRKWSAVYFTLRQLPEPRSPKIFMTRGLPLALMARGPTTRRRLPLHLCCRNADLEHVEARLLGGLVLGIFLERAAVFDRHHLLELALPGRPVFEDRLGLGRVGVVSVAGDELMQPLRVLAGHVAHDVDETVALEIAALVGETLHHLLLGRDRSQVDHGEVAAPLEGAVLVEYVGDATRHAGRKVAARDTDHHHHATGHVFTAVVTGTLNHRHRARVAHGKALAGNAAEVALSRDRPVEHRVADNDALLGHNAGAGMGPHDQFAAGKSLADVVVGLTDEVERDAVCQPGAEALPGGAIERQPDGILWQSGVT